MERVAHGADAAAGLAQLVAAIDDTLIDQIASEMAAAMSRSVFAADADADLTADALAASHETARGFMMGVADDPWTVQGTPHALINLALTLARRGFDITVLMKLVRYGQAVFWPAIMKTTEQAIEDPTLRMNVLATVFDRFGRYVETVLEGAVQSFQHERDLRVRGDQARRAEMIERILQDDESDLDRASRTLGYELRRLHTAFAVRSSEARDSFDRLEVIAQDIAHALGARRVLSMPSGSRGLWAWIATDAAPGPEQRRALEAVAIPAGLLVAIGHPARGLDGFRRSHQEALEAQRIASAAGGRAPLIWYEDIEIASMLFCNERAAKALVARELHGLTGQDRTSETLRRTTLAFLRCGCSATAAGREIGVHTNTVRNRIERVEAALGRELDDQQLGLQLALMLVDAVGPSVLPIAH